MAEPKEVMACVMQEREKFTGNIEHLLKSELLQSGDRNALFAIKRNLDLGMGTEDVRKRLLEIGSISPQLIALLVAFSIYKFYAKN